MKNRQYIIMLAIFFYMATCLSAQCTPQIVVGAERMPEYLPMLYQKKVGLVVNHTSVVGDQMTHLADTLAASGVNITYIFAPEHGFRGDADAGEVVKDGRDVRTGIAIVSLYGQTKKPSAEQMRNIDVMIFDIQDVGARFYTYISTMHYVMEACAEHGKEMIVLDRPNPCDYIDGPVLKQGYHSFVGMHTIPVLHGCTVGELAMMINGEGWLKSTPRQCTLKIIPLKGWKHGSPYSLPLKPSPNLPNDQSIRLYASLCPFEATKISVGRGTTFPFQVLGAPDKKFGAFTFTPRTLPGFDKNPMHKDKVCYGIDLRQAEAENGFSLKYIISFYKKSGEDEKFFARSRWMDLLMGTDTVRKDILAGKTEEEIRASWQNDLDNYKKTRAKYLLYNSVFSSAD